MYQCQVIMSGPKYFNEQLVDQYAVYQKYLVFFQNISCEIRSQFATAQSANSAIYHTHSIYKIESNLMLCV